MVTDWCGSVFRYGCNIKVKVKQHLLEKIELTLRSAYPSNQGQKLELISHNTLHIRPLRVRGCRRTSLWPFSNTLEG